MRKINILTDGFTTSNGSAFLFPLLVHKRSLENSNLDVNLVNLKSENITSCDVLCIDSKTFNSQWQTEPNYVIEKLNQLQDSGIRILYFDTTDSSGTIQSAVLPYVDKYLKNQLLIEKHKYSKPIYGGRIWSEYYRETAGILDRNDSHRDTAISENYIPKLGVSWNSGLSDYSTLGPWKISLYRQFPFRYFLKYPQSSAAPSSKRPKDITARFGTTYGRATVRYQREQIRKKLNNRLDTNKLGRYAYMKELRQSKIVVSPFGWGEITLKDFEVFLTGGMLLKPCMNHIITWPNFFQEATTYLSHDWNLNDLEERIDWAIENSTTRADIAANGQNLYVQHTSGPKAGELFANHFSNVIAT